MNATWFNQEACEPSQDQRERNRPEDTWYPGQQSQDHLRSGLARSPSGRGSHRTRAGSLAGTMPTGGSGCQVGLLLLFPDTFWMDLTMRSLARVHLFGGLPAGEAGNEYLISAVEANLSIPRVLVQGTAPNRGQVSKRQKE